MVFFHFKLLLANFRGEKGGIFMMGPWRHLASLRHCRGLFSQIPSLAVAFE